MAEIIITNDNFQKEVLESPIPVLVDFWAPWCGPCRMLGPELEKLAEEMDGVITVGKVNVDEETELSIKYNVMSIPTLLVFKNGVQTAKTIGYTKRDEIIKLLEN